ncbi:MAG: MFS transporter [Spirochaetales bacterium]|nr:MFS transporter [Spirochaetales bacterium]
MSSLPAPSSKRPKTRLERFRSRFILFNVLNSVAFMLLVGNIPTLFALELGATGTYIGLLGSLNFITYFFMPLGRNAITGRRIIGVFSWAWMLRHWSMVPALAAPFLAWAGYPGWGLVALFVGSLLFNVWRGVGLVGYNPVLGMMAGERDRGAFLSNVQISGSLSTIATSAATMLIFTSWTGNAAYGAMLGFGVLVGSIGSGMLFKFPEPTAYRPPSGSSFASTVREAWAHPSFRRFVFILAPLSFSAGTARTFIISHARILYEQSAGLVMLYFVAFNVGSVAVGYLSRKLMDRLGSKPLYVVFTAIAALAMLPAAVSPVFDTGLQTVIFLTALNFVVGFGIAGEENAGQTYFFSIVKPEHMVDLAILYYVVYGLGGALGSVAGGVFLDTLVVAGASPFTSYRLLYAVTFVITIATAIGGLRLDAPDSASVRESIGVLFSMRDFKVISLLERLERSGSPADETRLIRELGGYGSSVAERELLPYLSSPRFDVRVEALLALESLERLSPKALKAVHNELRSHPYTTAYLAARILGKRRWLEALPDLRTALCADDYMLRGAAVTALATMRDVDSVPAIEELIASTANPRLMISAASALEQFGLVSSVPILVSVLKQKEPPSFAFDEIVLALSGILGGLRGFYTLYSDYALDHDAAVAALLDALDDAAPSKGQNLDQLAAFRASLAAFVHDGTDGVVVARAISGSGYFDAGVAVVLSEAALDDELAIHGGFRYFLAACAVEAIEMSTGKGRR